MAPVQLITPVKTRMGSTPAAWTQLLQRSAAVDTLIQKLVERKYQARGPTRTQWTVVQFTVECLCDVSKVIAKQQTRISQYWLLSDSIMSMMQLFSTYSSHYSGMYSSMEDFSEDFKHEIVDLVNRMKSRIVETIQPAIAPLQGFLEEQSHVMLSLILDPR
jgi:hypothetical protein